MGRQKNDPNEICKAVKKNKDSIDIAASFELAKLYLYDGAKLYKFRFIGDFVKHYLRDIHYELSFGRRRFEREFKEKMLETIMVISFEYANSSMSY